ncbi:hypothetical protein NQ318_015957 [Aromia moschata]|uniref:Uncharacterized protein n=1 Tax=Aromia moschata TaxID=1265417 RepID=A0AAV8X9G3_9CUCU|nr:hypothetical protein NQ318_015957 [Aromia moschata]
MADDWSDEVQGCYTPALKIAELPEIKLFGRWNCDDVQVSDMSLQDYIAVKEKMRNTYLTQQVVLQQPRGSERHNAPL